MSADAAARMEDLYMRVVAPLAIGGALRPARPIGPRLARAIAALAGAFAPADEALGHRVDRARLTRAVALAPVDSLPPLGKGDWLLACALNDLLQAANPHLSSFLSPGRAERLIDATENTISLVAAPRDLRSCVARHATFAAVLRVTRTDTTVRWWTGSATFLGEEPPPRLLAWPEVRRVRTEATPTTIDELAAKSGTPEPRYVSALASWLAKTPLTDLASAGREAPPFRWTAATLAIVATRAGAALARRATSAGGPRADVALERATREIESPSAAAFARTFLEERRAHAAVSP